MKKAYICRKSAPGPWVVLEIENGAVSVSFLAEEPDWGDPAIEPIKIADGMKIKGSADPGSRGFLITGT